MLQRFEKTQKHINGNLSKHTNNVKYVQYTASKDMCVCVYLESIKHFHTLRDINIFLHMYHIYIYILNFIQKKLLQTNPIINKKLLPQSHSFECFQK